MAKSVKILLLEAYRKFLNEDVSPEVIERFKNLPIDELCNLIVNNRIDQDIYNGLFADFITSKYYANDDDGDEKRDRLAMELIGSKYVTLEQLKAFIDNARVHKSDKFRLKEATIKYQAKVANRNYSKTPNVKKEQVPVEDDIKELEVIPVRITMSLISLNKLTKTEYVQLFNLFMSSKFYNNVNNGEALKNDVATALINAKYLVQNADDKSNFKALLRKFCAPRFRKVHQCDMYIIRRAKEIEHSL